VVASYVDGRLDGELQNWREDGSLYERATFQRGQKMTTTLSTTLAPAR
jgi:antitoxin component YwqK of YwqJK toxin-antitoxin module